MYVLDTSGLPDAEGGWAHVAVTLSPDHGAVIYVNGQRLHRVDDSE